MSDNTFRLVPVFSGGGTRLTAHIGILDALTKLQCHFPHIVGVSGGSIVAALYCAGYSTDKIKAIAMETDFNQFRGYSLWRLLKTGGLCSGEKFEQWMDRVLDGITFEELELDLHILATDVNGGGPVIFDKMHSPKLKVSKAVRFSMSIPLLFSFQPYNDHILVDGAILAEDALFEDWAGDGTPVVCFRLKSETEINNIKPIHWFPVVTYIELLIRTFMTAISREYVQNGFWHNTIVINTGTMSSVNFALSQEQKESLYFMGFFTVQEYLPKKLAHYVKNRIEK